jgi:hypothetical protein
LNEDHREDIERVRTELWLMYKKLKHYKRQSRKKDQRHLQRAFDTLFAQKTRYRGLNELLKRLRQNKEELLLVLQRPQGLCEGLQRVVKAHIPLGIIEQTPQTAQDQGTPARGSAMIFGLDEMRINATWTNGHVAQALRPVSWNHSCAFA